MALTTGTRLGSYEVISAIGAGGMGEVYRARDTKLGREVAIKVILQSLSADRERIVRLEREAKALAVLNHPAIATLHGLEEFEGRHFLVMEVVEGETLAERLARGPMTIADALAIGRQIAEALEAAHERGIIHRDLKPANVKITPDERVKLLDFGLAKATDADPQSPNSPANSPTISAMGTQAGVILGTASYMSPEQARGFAADHRSDIFSFGVVMYEMLAGRQPFQGETVSDVLASVLVRDVDLHALPADVHPPLIDLVRRCLEKSPRRRWQAIGDVRYELEQIATTAARPSLEIAAPPPAARPIWRRVLPIALTAIAAASITAAIAWWWLRPVVAPGPVTRFPIVLQEFQQLTALNRPVLAVSPDGSQLAFTANRQLFIRHMSDLTVRRIFDNPGASLLGSLAFSPDSTQLAFYSTADTSLKRISVNGGAPIPICKLTVSPSGLTWTDGALYFATDSAIVRVPDTGGSTEQLIALGPGESAHRPQLLPGGAALLYTVATGTENDRWDRAKVVAQRLDGSARVTIVEVGTDGRYVPSGHVLYALGGLLFAVPFDPATLRLSGGQVTVVEGVRRGTGPIGSASAQFAVSDTGTLAFLPGPVTASPTAQLYQGLFDMAGRADPLKIPPGPYSLPRISPDGRWIAYGSDDGRDVSIWVYDMKTGGSPRRLTFGGKNVYPIWSSDSTRVLFQSDREGDLAIFRQRADGTGVAERVTKPEGKAEHIAHAMSSDGRTLLLDVAVDGKYTLHALSLASNTMTPFGGVTSFTHTGAAFSRDGKWVTYAVKGTAQSTSVVYVQPFPATGALFQISPNSEDGHHQIWSPDGARIFYRPGPGVRIVAVGIRTTPTLAIGDIASVPSPFTNAPPSAQRTFDMMPDGKHFLALTASPNADSTLGATEVQIVLNWFEDLRRRAPGTAAR